MTAVTEHGTSLLHCVQPTLASGFAAGAGAAWAGASALASGFGAGVAGCCVAAAVAGFSSLGAGAGEGAGGGGESASLLLSAPGGAGASKAGSWKDEGSMDSPSRGNKLGARNTAEERPNRAREATATPDCSRQAGVQGRGAAEAVSKTSGLPQPLCKLGDISPTPMQQQASANAA